MTDALQTSGALCEPASSGRDAETLRRIAITDYKILGTGPEPAFDDLALLVAQVFGSQFAAISFIGDDHQWFKAACGIPQGAHPLTGSFCLHTVATPSLFLVKDSHLDPRVVDSPFVTGAPNVRFYAGMRIMSASGAPIASLCAFDTEPRPQGLTEVQEVTLRVLASQAETLLKLRLAVIEHHAQVVAQTELAKKLQHMADHDVLTDLPHRGVFKKRLISAIDEAAQNGTRVATMLIDLDHFKQINDSQGHDVGDALLCNFANRLRSVVRKNDTVARFGGDEFGVLLKDINCDEEIATLVRSMNSRLHKPMVHNGQIIDCKPSIGLAIYPDHAVTALALIKCSDLALAEAKQSRGTVETFCPSMAEEFERDAQMLAIAREGIENKCIVPHYQPKINLTSGALVGFEALVRCDRIGRGTIPPDMFSLAFADRELAVAISDQMINHVLDDMRAWVDKGIAFGHIAINTCAADFRGNDFAENLLAGIRSRGLDPGLVEVEVTEGVFLGRGTHHVARALTLLSESGIRIALDDFGTGYASLTHLRQFPVNVLKIDRSFVAGIGKSRDDKEIVRALIGIGRNLGIETVAEGIETHAQAEFVNAHGCDLGQGFLYGAAQAGELVPSIVARYEKPRLYLKAV